eukprot:2998521-Amphidinium_carterae.2
MEHSAALVHNFLKDVEAGLVAGPLATAALAAQHAGCDDLSLSLVRLRRAQKATRQEQSTTRASHKSTTTYGHTFPRKPKPPVQRICDTSSLWNMPPATGS